MKIPVNLSIDPEDRPRIDKALEVFDRFVIVLERLTKLLKEEEKK